MSKLISGKEALIALANGEEVQIESNKQWVSVDNCQVYQFLNRDCSYKFRLKPRTITINGVEVPAPFEPKEGDDFRVYYLHGLHERGYDWMHSTHYREFHLVWRTEAEIKQVIAALRSIFKPQ